MSPLLARDVPYKRKGTINVMSEGFISGGESTNAREVYVVNISIEITLEKRP